MAHGTKYNSLPDLDTSPDVYESQLTSKPSGEADAPSSPQDSETSVDYETPGSEEDAQENDNTERNRSRVTRHKVPTAQARSRFAGSRVDATDADFSDQIVDGKKSYRSLPAGRRPRRRRVRRENGYISEYDYDYERDETLQERIARLKREVAEVQAERAEHVKAGEEVDGEEEIEALSTVLSSMHEQIRTKRPPRKPQQLSNGSSVVPTPASSSVVLDPSNILAKAAALDSRLAQLENALGLDGVLEGHADAAPNTNVLSSLAKLESQMGSLESTTIPSLASMQTKIDQLISAADKLAAARKAAHELAERENNLHLIPHYRPPESQPANGEESTQQLLDPATAIQIHSLHKHLDTVTSISPIVPRLLERLRSLRRLHADAAMSSQRVAEVELLQDRMSSEITKWSTTLSALEGRMTDAQTRAADNKKAADSWVKNLEDRIGKLSES